MASDMVGRLGTIDSAKFLIDEILRPVRNVGVMVSLIGAIAAGKILWTVGREMFRGGRLFFWEQHFACKERLLRKYGHWALVTGIGHGLATEFARHLAANGLNLILVGTDSDVLDQLSQTLKTGYGVRIKYFVVNPQLIHEEYLGDPNLEGEIVREIRKCHVGMLVINSDNYMPPVNDSLHTISSSNLWSRMQLEITTGVMLTRTVIQDMNAMGRGAIVTVVPSSEPDTKASPHVLAQRQYFTSFNEGLRTAYSHRHITVLTLNPYSIDFRCQHFAYRFCNQGIFAPSPYLYVKSAMKLLGVTDISTGYWAHGLQHVICKVMPGNWWCPTKSFLEALIWRQGRIIHPRPSSSNLH